MRLDALLMIILMSAQLVGTSIKLYKSHKMSRLKPPPIYQTAHPEIDIYTIPATYTQSDNTG